MISINTDEAVVTIRDALELISMPDIMIVKANSRTPCGIYTPYAMIKYDDMAKKHKTNSEADNLK